MAGKKKDIAADTPKWEDVPEIPKEEQPWPLPEGWKWVKVGDILNLQAGKNITSKFINSIKTADYQYPCYGGNGVRGYVKDFNHNGEFFIIGRQGALCGNIHHVCGKFYATEHAVVVTSKTYYIDINYAGNYLEFMNLNQYATATAQPGLAVSNILKLPFLLPPLSIQQRIVTIIKSLFSKLDEAAEKVQAVIDSHEARKQAILHRAFSGELTKDIAIKEDETFNDISEIPVKEQPYPLPNGWKWVRGNKIFSPGGNISPKGDFFEYIDIESIDNTKQIIKSSKKIAVKDAPSRAKRKLSNGDTLFSMVRPYLKNIAYVDETFSSCIASTGFYVCRPYRYINGRYLFWLMTSDYVVNGLNRFMRGDNSPSIKPEHIENFLFPLPPKNIQIAISKVIESIYSQLDSFIELVIPISDKCIQLKKIILNKAFSGNLIKS